MVRLIEKNSEPSERNNKNSFRAFCNLPKKYKAKA